MNQAGESVSQLAIGERFGVRMQFEVFEAVDERSSSGDLRR